LQLLLNLERLYVDYNNWHNSKRRTLGAERLPVNSGAALQSLLSVSGPQRR